MFRFRDYFTFKRSELEHGDTLVFYKCTLKKHIGDYRPGSFFYCIEFDFISMRLTFYQYDNIISMTRFFSLEDTPMD